MTQYITEDESNICRQALYDALLTSPEYEQLLMQCHMSFHHFLCALPAEPVPGFGAVSAKWIHRWSVGGNSLARFLSRKRFSADKPQELAQMMYEGAIECGGLPYHAASLVVAVFERAFLQIALTKDEELKTG